jgi:type I restriction enzyme S subunit
MMEKFEFIKVGELVDSGEADLQTGPFGTQLKASDYVDEGTPGVRIVVASSER